MVKPIGSVGAAADKFAKKKEEELLPPAEIAERKTKRKAASEAQKAEEEAKSELAQQLLNEVELTPEQQKKHEVNKACDAFMAEINKIESIEIEKQNRSHGALYLRLNNGITLAFFLEKGDVEMSLQDPETKILVNEKNFQDENDDLILSKLTDEVNKGIADIQKKLKKRIKILEKNKKNYLKGYKR